jgi:hypothetical protein
MMALSHGLWAGTDTKKAFVQFSYLTSGASGDVPDLLPDPRGAVSFSPPEADGIATTSPRGGLTGGARTQGA